MNEHSNIIVYNSLSNSHFLEEKLNNVSRLIADSIDDKLFPGIEIMLFRGNKILLHKVFGNKCFNETLSLNSIFDVASLTKAMITNTLIMILVEQGKLKLRDKISLFFPEYGKNEKKLITIKHLLTHTSGLPAWENLYENIQTKEQAIQKLLNLPLECHTGSKVIYSCLGFILLKLILEKIVGIPIDKLAKKWIFEPLEMKNSYFNPPKCIWDRIPPTGECKWRNRIILGEVHDENAYFLGGLSGNAGLFSTTYDIVIFSNMLLNKGTWNGKRILTAKSVSLMTQNNIEVHSPRGLGFNMKAPDHQPCGELFGKYSFGHTGFTGTSFWIDPESFLGIVLLSNRVHLSYRANIESMKAFRIKAHNALISALK